MSTQQQLSGNWNQLKGKIKQKWGQVSDDELQQVEGDYDQLVGLIQKKTGQARQEIERMVSNLNEEVGSRLGQATDTARHYAEQAGERLRGTGQQLRDRTREGFEGAQDMVRRHPTESLASAFGTGLVVGLLIGLCVSSMQQESSSSWRGWR